MRLTGARREGVLARSRSRAVQAAAALVLTVALTVALAAVLAAASPARADEALDVRLRHLESGLRCLVCQNQTLAESDADLAADLRREVRAQALAGKSDDEIRRYLVARYGDFVLYDPPLKPVTWLLWFGPFALLAAGVAAWYFVGRSRRGKAPEPPFDSVARARSLLDCEDGAAADALRPAAQAASPSGDAPRQALDA